MLREPAVTAETGGAGGGGAIVTPVGERVVGLYRPSNASARGRRRRISGNRQADPPRRRNVPPVRRAGRGFPGSPRVSAVSVSLCLNSPAAGNGMTEHIAVTDDGAIRIIRLNRPEKKNALTRAMYDADERGRCRRPAQSDAIRCVLSPARPGRSAPATTSATFSMPRRAALASRSASRVSPGAGALRSRWSPRSAASPSASA